MRHLHSANPCHPEAAESSAERMTPNEEPVHLAAATEAASKMHRSFGPQTARASG